VTDDSIAPASGGPVRRTLRRSVIAVGVVIALCLVCVGGTTLSLLGGLFGQNPSTPLAFGCGNGKKVDPTGPLPSISGLVEEQVQDAAIKNGAQSYLVKSKTGFEEIQNCIETHLGSRN